MKRAMFPVLFVVAFLAIGATKALHPEVQQVLEKALAGEREAVARYELFALKADEEGLPGAASLFRAQAVAERTHATRFSAALKSAGVTVPEEQPALVTVGTTTEENLRAAIAAETKERDTTYREAIAAAGTHGATDVAKMLEQTRDSEVEHANLCNAALRDPAALKSPKAYHVCGKCGYTTDVKLPFCPACQVQAPLKKVE